MADRERTYLIRVSAVLDRSTSAAAGDLVQQFDRVTRAQERSTQAGQKSQERSSRYVAGIRDRHFREQQRAEEKAAKETERAQEKSATAAARAQKQAADATSREASRAAKEQERAQAYVARVKDRYFRDDQRRAEQEERREDQRSKRAVVRAEKEAKDAYEKRKARTRQIAGDAYGDVMGMGRTALGVGGQIAGGFGVNFDVGSGIAKAVQLQKMAVGIVNAGNRGDGSAGDRDAQVKGLQEQARAIGNKYAFDPAKMLGGFAQFQAKTGDMATAGAGLERFAKLAKAFNVELDDMISAAGEISSKLEDGFKPGEERAAKTYEVLKLLTAQGQEGAIEISDLAKETARLGGGAGFFKGDIGSTIGKLGAFAQLARQTGGANSAADSARAVAAFVTTLKTPARREAFKKNKVDFTDADGSFLDPMTIVKNALRATGGDTEKMNEMFKSSLGTKPVDALTKAFRSGGGGESGIAEVDKLLAKFNRPVTEGTIAENANRAMGTTESKAQLFQNKLDAVMASLADRVLPAFEKMAPNAEKVAAAFADLVAYVSNNTGQAITLAIVGSITKAAIGPSITKALVDTISGKPGTALGGGGKIAGMPAGTSNVLGSAMAIGTVAVATFTVGSMLVDKIVEAGDQADTGHMNDELRVGESESILRGAAKTGQISAEDKAKLEANVSMLRERIAIAKNEKNQVMGGSFGAMLRAGENYVTGEGPGMAKLEQGQKDIPQLASLEAKFAEQSAALAALKSGTMQIVGKVEVTNMPTGGPTTDGREGVP